MEVHRRMALLPSTSRLETCVMSEPILQFFEYAHLPPHLQVVSKIFAGAAAFTIACTPRNPERTVALRKLLEAKDAAVRAKLYKEPAA
jgi:hypothetical protein